MKFLLAIIGVVIAVSLVKSSPIIKRETDDLSPLNEVYVFQNENDQSLDEEPHGDREKRKIGVIKLGVSNGIINFVFGKLDSFLDAKTKALGVLDESNKAKNAIYGIDPKQSATKEFISDIIGKKIQAGTAGIGPLINSATTFISTKSQGLVGALTSKFAPLSSLSGGLSGGSGDSGSPGGGSGGGLGGILSLVTSLSGSSSSGLGGLGGLSGGSPHDDKESSEGGSSSGGTGITIGDFPSIGGGYVSGTTDDTPIFDRNKVSLEVPSKAFGTGFTLVTNISKLLGKLILNSAHRTENVLEVFKPFFRGAFAIKGLPSDNEIHKKKRQSSEINQVK
ncbi:uncharacterized protein LOC130668573 [Microplitis mediator]|uniref:uncharacterized protein LOC130668573 n=1 Tax=Microplitis mediator TaxID=375433 RepID=UPI0025538215|nr:uncharacterized protein LOC130668573 [Microplitis mediator]